MLTMNSLRDVAAYLNISYVAENLPSTETVKKVISFAPSVITDLLLLPLAGHLLSNARMAYDFGVDFNPTLEEIKKGLPAIVLLHGSGFNESEFIIAREYLNKEQYGSVFSFNLNGLIMYGDKDGIDDYANGIISIRNYYNVYSKADWAVSYETGKLTENPERVLAYNFVGHYGLIALPTTWNWVTSILDKIYV